jgi:hypothetical protein
MNRTHAARTTVLFLLVAAGFALLAALLMPNPASAAVVHRRALRPLPVHLPA